MALHGQTTLSALPRFFLLSSGVLRGLYLKETAIWPKAAWFVHDTFLLCRVVFFLVLPPFPRLSISLRLFLCLLLRFPYPLFVCFLHGLDGVLANVVAQPIEHLAHKNMSVIENACRHSCCEVHHMRVVEDMLRCDDPHCGVGALVGVLR